jgi:transposase-like protein
MITTSTNQSTVPQGAASAGAMTAEPIERPKPAAKRVFAGRRLTDDQQREVTRLYAETTTPVADIARHFGIAQTAVSRIAQRYGATLRTPRLSRSTANGTPVAPEAAPVSSPAAEEAVKLTEAVTAPTLVAEEAQPEGVPQRQQRAPVKRAGAAPTPTRRGLTAASTVPSTSAAKGQRLRFRITFSAEQIFTASTILDALKQAEARGAVDVTSITRLG